MRAPPSAAFHITEITALAMIVLQPCGSTAAAATAAAKCAGRLASSLRAPCCLPCSSRSALELHPAVRQGSAGSQFERPARAVCSIVELCIVQAVAMAGTAIQQQGLPGVQAKELCAVHLFRKLHQ